MVSDFPRDLRHAVRGVRRNPGFALAAIAPIALAIGIDTSVFTVLYNVIARPLPAPAPAELISVYQDFEGVKGRRVHGARVMFSAPEYHAYRHGSKTLAGLLAYSKPWTVSLGGDAPQEADGILVSCNYFEVLGIRPAIGTAFDAACDASSAAPAIVLTHGLWTRSFAADPAVVGRTITVNGQAVRIAGVAPRGFEGIALVRTAFFAPASMLPVLEPGRRYDDPQVSWLTLIGRRAPGADLATVRAELDVIARQIDRQQPGRTTTLIVSPAMSMSLPVARQEFVATAALVLGAFSLILVLACANVANVLLARGATRAREIAVRLSAGASRWRLVRLLLTESALLAAAGGAAGVLLSWWSTQALLASVAGAMPMYDDQPRIDALPDLAMLWFALALTGLTAIACGLAPALQATRLDVHGALKQGAALTGGRTGWLRGTFIAVQVAVCLVLLIGAGLLLRALHAAQTIDPGFESRNVAVLSADLRGPSYADRNVDLFQRQVLERVAALPGIDAVAHVSRVPWSPGRTQATFRLTGDTREHDVDMNAVSPAYFALLRIPIVQGRAFTAADTEGPPRTVIVTAATARRYWPGRDPVGRTIVMGSGPPLEIVGVVRDAQISNVPDLSSSYVYLPGNPWRERRLTLLVRSQVGFDALAAGLRDAARSVEPGLVARVLPLDDNLEQSRTRSRVIATLAGALGLLALLLASIGVSGVVAFIVVRRHREIGVRLSLGATPYDVRALILRQALRPVAIGLALGLAAATIASGLLGTLLFGISPLDPIAFAGASMFLLGVAAVASLVPLRRASAVDPMITLRAE